MAHPFFVRVTREGPPLECRSLEEWFGYCMVRLFALKTSTAIRAWWADQEPFVLAIEALGAPDRITQTLRQAVAERLAITMVPPQEPQS